MVESRIQAKAPRETLSIMAGGNPRLIKYLEQMQDMSLELLPNEITALVYDSLAQTLQMMSDFQQQIDDSLKQLMLEKVQFAEQLESSQLLPVAIPAIVENSNYQIFTATLPTKESEITIDTKLIDIDYIIATVKCADNLIVGDNCLKDDRKFVVGFKDGIIHIFVFASATQVLGKDVTVRVFRKGE